MEHLPLPKGVKPFIIVPYEALKKDWYDNEGFIDFPQRCGWTEEQLRGGDDTTKDVFQSKGDESEVEQFFQTWLFFGMAIDFLKMGGVTAKTEDFLVDANEDNSDMPKMVNTSKLPLLLTKWQAGVGHSGVSTQQLWKDLKQMFERSRSILHRFCVPEYEKDWPLRQGKPRQWPVRDGISTTIIALTFSLRRAAMESGYSDEVDPLTPWLHARSEILWKRLQQKWCVADVTTAFKELSIDGHYYLAASPGLKDEELDHHSRCIKEHCLYDYDTNMYVTRHAEKPWHKPGCKTTIQYGGQLGPERGQKDWVDAIGRIINKDAIPIALWVKGLRTLWSVEYHLTGKRQPAYVAISHVWTDGKGNPKANSLPECQLDRITHFVENLHWEGRKPIPENPSESDGIGFWMDTLCIPVDNKDLKKKAIASMRHVYSNAKAVLVLDDWLQEIPSNTSMLDIVTRLYQSNWIKRLWTHQEGFLPSDVYVQFSDKSVHMDILRQKFEDYQKQQIKLGMYLQFPLATNIRLLDLYSGLKWIMRGVSNINDKWKLYAPLADAMSERKTARLADETVCLATIIDIDVKPFLDISEKSDVESADKRMALFLQKLHTFQMKLVFNNYERLEETGYRWAPRSLLNFRTARLYNGDDQRTTTFQVISGKRGLLVQYPGFLITFTNGMPSFGTAERGCVIRYRQESAQRTTQRIDGKYIVIELPPNNVRWTESSSQPYAVILSALPTKGGQACQAIVGLTTSTPSNDVYSFEHRSVGTARIENTAPNWVEAVEAPLLGNSTRWLVF